MVEDTASVHLSISKHSQLSSLSTGGEVISFFPFLPSITVLLSSLHFCFPPSAPAFSPVSYLLPTSPFISFPNSLLSFFPSFLLLFLFPLHPSLLHPLLVVSYALSGTAHSATKQSCLQHHTLANQARPECSSPQIHSTAP